MIKNNLQDFPHNNRIIICGGDCMKIKLLIIALAVISVVGYIAVSYERPHETEQTENVYVDSQGRGLIKGNINDKHEKIYHMPGQNFYDICKPEKWFKTEEDAKRAGFRKSKV
jgi:hypothetical protein